MLQLSWRREHEFEVFYRQWITFVYNVAYRMTGNHAETEEIAQEAFLRVYRFVETFRGGSLKSWLYRIVMNLCYTRLQKNKVRYINEVSLDQNGNEGDDLQERLKDHTGDPGQQLDRQELSDRVQRALNTLPEEQRSVLILSDVEGLSYKEISDIVGCPVGTVRSRLCRSRLMFRAAIKRQESRGRNLSCF